MPPKSKAGKGKVAESKAAPPPPPPAPPTTVDERTAQVYALTNPHRRRRDAVGHAGLDDAERRGYAASVLLRHSTQRQVFASVKNERDFLKAAAREGLPVRQLRAERHDWGRDARGRHVGQYSPDEFAARRKRRAALAALELLSEAFRARRDLGGREGPEEEEEKEEEEERQRRRQMASMREELYGVKMPVYSLDPAWDDVVPIPAEEPEGALAAIAYPEAYSDAMGYLRAVMAADECSPRCLRLTEDIIGMNPAHYTIWLYRFRIISTLGLSVPDEIAWLNDIALQHLKNYQIWHHRQQLIDCHHAGGVGADAAAVAELARSESAFLGRMLAEDAKNYHVWSYRQYLVRKLGMWTADELAATEAVIDDDVRNNSAWSHRFFLVFSDPAGSTPGCPATERDGRVPPAVVDRELAYARVKISAAPQNQSPWNFARGVLAKGGRALAELHGFAAGFVEKLGEEGEEGEEVVRSSHALEMLGDIAEEKGDGERARLCFGRLAERWDVVRRGYWQFRVKQLEAKGL